MRTNKSINLLAGLLCASLLCGFAVDGRAATRGWDNDANDNDWFNPINWFPNGAPDSADQLGILGGSPEANGIVYADANGSIIVSGSGAYASFLRELHIGETSVGTLAIQNGGSVTSDWAIMGYDPNASGAATVDGVGSRLDINQLTVGWRGTGTLNVQSGGSVSSSSAVLGSQYGSSGTMTVDGVGSSLNSNGLTVGGDGTGTLTIQNGGSVSSGSVNINDGVFSSTSNGTVTVDGAGSSLDSNELVVGFWGPGTLAIQNGGSVSSNTAYIGLLGGPGAVTVDGVGSSLDSNELVVGGYGTGTLTIENGGSVSSSLAAIGISDISGGTVTVDGAGSAWTNSGDLYIGDANSAGGTGTGTLTVENGGTVAVAGTVKVWGTGSVELLGSDIEAGSFIVDPNGTFIHADGTLTVDGGTFDPGVSGGYMIDGPTVAELPTVKLANGATASLGGMAIVGNSNRGALEIRSGSTVSSGSAYIGLDANSSGTVTVDGVGSSLDGNWLYVGFDGTGTLEILSGGSVSGDRSFVGVLSNSSGAVTVDGMGSSLDSNWLYVGWDGTGTLEILSGGSVSSGEGYVGSRSGSSGTVNIDASASIWNISTELYVGGDANSAGGTGVVNISDGNGGMLAVGGTLKVWSTGTVNLNTRGLVVGDTVELASGGAFNTASDSTLRVNALVGFGSNPSFAGKLAIGHAGGSGSGSHSVGSGQSLSVSEYLTLGYDAAGTLNVQSGGSVSSWRAYIGYDGSSSGTVTVDGVGSSLNSMDLYVGDRGTGTLDIQNGGSVSSYNAEIGRYAPASGTVTVDGVGSRLNSNGLVVGYYGTGTLDIQNGGSVSNATAYIGYKASASGTVTVDGNGSTWTNSGDLYVGGDANSAGGTGTLTVDNGGTAAVAGTLKVWGSGSVELLGSDIEAGSLIVDPNATFNHADGTLTINGGTVVPGVSDYTIDGPTPAELPTVKLLSGATASLGGTLIVGKSNRGALEIRSGGGVSAGSTQIADLGNSSGAVTVDGVGSRLDSNKLEVGRVGTGTLEILNGGSVSTGWASIGREAISSGTVTVDGGNSTLEAHYFYIGYLGTGTLDIQNGGSVSNTFTRIGYWSGSGGTVTVDGVGSSLDSNKLEVGYKGTGTLTIQSGGSVTSDYAYIGHDANSSGTVTVAGNGSTWTNSGDLYVGGDGNSAGGTGTLTVENGGTAAVAGTLKVWGSGSVELLGSDIEAGSFIVDPNGTFTHEDGTLTVNGGTFDPGASYYIIDGPTPAELPTVKLLSGATASLSGTLIVGNSNRGALEILSGGSVSDGGAYIGHSAGSTGQATVSGTGSTWTNSGSLYVGYDGNAVLGIFNGGGVWSQTGYVGFHSGSSGTVNIDTSGSIWSISTALYVGGDANGHGGSGVVSLANGGTLNVGGTVRIWNTGKLTGHGTVGGDIVSDGVVAPGTFAGTLTIWGDYTQEANGILQIELGGLDTNDFDVLDIFGDATLDGTLDVSLIHAFEPNVGDTFVIIDANSVSGTFATESGTDLGDGLVLDVVYGQSDVSLLAILIGDMDASGKVDADDVNPFVLALTDPNAYIAGYSMDPNVVGDCDYSGKLDTDDISPFVALVTGGSPAVPEPAALLMFCGAAAGVLLKRRRKS